LILLATAAAAAWSVEDRVARAQPTYPNDAAIVTTLNLAPDGARLVALAVNPSTGRIYAADAARDSLLAIDGTASAVISTILVGRTPCAVAVDPEANRVYVANSGSNDVTVVDGDSNDVVATLAVGEEPQDLAIDSTTGRVFVGNHRSGTVSVIDGAHSAVIRTVPVEGLPTAVAVNPSAGRVYVADSMSDHLTVIDSVSNLVIANVALDHGSSVRTRDVAVDAATNRVYVAGSPAETGKDGTGAVTVIDAGNHSLIASIILPGPADALAVDSTRARIYAGGVSDDYMWVVDGYDNVLTSAVGLKGALSAIEVDPTSGRVYLASGEGSGLSIVSWMAGVTLSRGWTHACYMGEEKPIDDALTGARVDVLAAYRLGPEGAFDRWFPNRPELSTITTVRPQETLFLLADDYVSWPQEPADATRDLAPGSGWNAICYPRETREAAAAIGGMSGRIAVAYFLAPNSTWGRIVPGRPDLTNLTHLRSYSALIVFVPAKQTPEREALTEEASEEFLALRSVLEDSIANYYGDVAICVLDLQTNEEICVNGDALHRTGCTINMFALFAAVEEFQAGRANPEEWADWIRIGIGHSSPPQVAVFLEGLKGSLEIGVRRANELMQSWGMRDSLFDHVPGYPGPDWRPNILTARETNMVLAKLYRGELFSAEWTVYAIGRLLDIKPGLNYVLPGLLPAGVRVAHKIGYYADSDGWVYNDAGIVMVEREATRFAYGISYLSQAMPSEYAAYSFGAQLSKTVYDWFEQQH
jgi:YVTN family beta-propeller protein